MEWQPIETAPKDGTVVLLYGVVEDFPQSRAHIGCEDVEVAYWDSRVEGWQHNYLDGYVVSPVAWAPWPTVPAWVEGLCEL